MWNGRRRGLEGEPGDDHREPQHEQRVVGVAGERDVVEGELPGRAVDERGAEQERRRADRADHEVLEPGLERADQVDVDRAHHVERDREPLEADEQRHQVRGLHEEVHPGSRRGEQREVLGDVLLAHPLAVGDQHRDQPAACDEDLRHRRPAVAEDRVGDDRLPLRAAVVDEHREDERRQVPGGAEDGRDGAAGRLGAEDGGQHQQRGRSQQRQRGRDREPVDVRLDDHFSPFAGAAPGGC